MGIENTGYKQELLSRTTFDEDCQAFETDHPGFREEYYKQKFSDLSFPEFLYMLDGGFFDAAKGDAEYLPAFTMTPPNSMTYKCTLGDEAAYPDEDSRMTQVGCIRLFEQKLRECVVGDISTHELIVWFTLLRLTEQQFSNNVHLFMSRLMATQAI